MMNMNEKGDEINFVERGMREVANEKVREIDGQNVRGTNVV